MLVQVMLGAGGSSTGEIARHKKDIKSSQSARGHAARPKWIDGLTRLVPVPVPTYMAYTGAVSVLDESLGGTTWYEGTL